MDAYGDIVGAYEGVEALDRFARDTLTAYRKELLMRSAEQVAFLRARLRDGARLLEVASGNGRLLVGLAAAGALSEGIGIEIAKSRVRFAERWAADERLEQITFVAADALAAELPNDVDAVVCITGAFAYFEPMRAGASRRLLRSLRNALRPGGLLVLELYPHPEARRLLDASGEDELRTWRELASDDPWRFYLSRLHVDDATGVLHHDKLFVHRTSGEIDDTRREHLRLYSLDELEALLTEAGFENVQAAGGWKGESYDEGTSELLVVTATGSASSR
jgi:SAM-dependent methyltransferase